MSTTRTTFSEYTFLCPFPAFALQTQRGGILHGNPCLVDDLVDADDAGQVCVCVCARRRATPPAWKESLGRSYLVFDPHSV